MYTDSQTQQGLVITVNDRLSNPNTLTEPIKTEHVSTLKKQYLTAIKDKTITEI